MKAKLHFLIGVVFGLVFLSINTKGEDIELRRVGSAVVGGATYYDVVLSGQYAYVGTSAGLQIFDISDPELPVETGTVQGYGVASLVIAGNTVYTAEFVNGLQVYDVSNPAEIKHLGGVDLGGSAQEVTISGNHALVVCRNVGLKIIDITDVSNPQVISALDFASFDFLVSDVAVRENHAYIGRGSTLGAGWYFELQVIDISDPYQPTRIFSARKEDTPTSGIQILGNLMYVVPAGQVFNIENPVDIQYVESFGVWHYIPVEEKLTISENRLYHGASDGLFVYSLDDPENPNRIGEIETLDYISGIAAQGDYVYLAEGAVGLQVLALLPKMQINFEQIDGKISLLWDSGLLQSADSVGSDWGNVDGAQSPYPLETIGQQMFFRLIGE